MASLIESFRYHNGENTFRKYLTYTIFKRRDENGNFMDFIDFIRSLPDKPWDCRPWGWYGISLNPNITMETIEAFPDKPLNIISRIKFEKDNQLFDKKNKIIYDL